MGMTTRHRCILGLGITLWLLASLAHAGALVIELHNGREIHTSDVWEDGDEIKFSAAHGTVGVPKTQVKRITTSPLADHPRVSPPPAPTSPPEPNGGMTDRAAETPASPRPDTPLDAREADAFRARKATLIRQLNDATDAYLQASGAKQPEAKQQALQQMRDTSARIYALADDVKHTHGGTLPAWWDD